MSEREICGFEVYFFLYYLHRCRSLLIFNSKVCLRSLIINKQSVNSFWITHTHTSSTTNDQFFFFFLYFLTVTLLWDWGFPGGSDGKESACSVGDPGSILGLGRCPGGGHSNPLQYSCLQNPINRRAWWATVHGVSHKESGISY